MTLFQTVKLDSFIHLILQHIVLPVHLGDMMKVVGLVVGSVGV